MSWWGRGMSRKEAEAAIRAERATALQQAQDRRHEWVKNGPFDAPMPSATFAFALCLAPITADEIAEYRNAHRQATS